MNWLMRLFGRLSHSRAEPLPPLPPVDREKIRAEMKRTDPSFRRVSEGQHDAMNVLTGNRMARQIRDGLSIRREREFWERYGGDHPGGPRP